jgi:hypothetical protein
MLGLPGPATDALTPGEAAATALRCVTRHALSTAEAAEFRAMLGLGPVPDGEPPAAPLRKVRAVSESSRARNSRTGRRYS